MVWSVMAAADEAGRVKLDAFLRDVEVLIKRKAKLISNVELEHGSPAFVSCGTPLVS